MTRRRGYFGSFAPQIELRDSGVVQETYILPAPSFRLFQPVPIQDPEINPFIRIINERRFGFHLQFDFTWKYIGDDDMDNIIAICNNTEYDVYLIPFKEITAIEYLVFLQNVNLPFTSGKLILQGCELSFYTKNLQTEIKDIFNLFVASSPISRKVII